MSDHIARKHYGVDELDLAIRRANGRIFLDDQAEARLRNTLDDHARLRPAVEGEFRFVTADLDASARADNGRTILEGFALARLRNSLVDHERLKVAANPLARPMR